MTFSFKGGTGASPTLAFNPVATITAPVNTQAGEMTFVTGNTSATVPIYVDDWGEAVTVDASGGAGGTKATLNPPARAQGTGLREPGSAGRRARGPGLQHVDDQFPRS